MYLICTYLYFCVLLLVFSVICMHQGVREQFQFSVCMYGTCGRIDNKADFDFDFDVTFSLFVINLIRMLVTSRAIAYSPVAYGQYNNLII